LVVGPAGWHVAPAEQPENCGIIPQFSSTTASIGWDFRLLDAGNG
jgi:hypothetical protein